MHPNARLSTCVLPGAGSRSAGLDTSACIALLGSSATGAGLSAGPAGDRHAAGALVVRPGLGPAPAASRVPAVLAAPQRRTAQQHAGHAHRGPLTAAHGADTALVQLGRDLPEAHAGLAQLGHHGPDAPSEVVGGLRQCGPAKRRIHSALVWPLAVQRLTLLSPCARRASPMP